MWAIVLRMCEAAIMDNIGFGKLYLLNGYDFIKSARKRLFWALNKQRKGKGGY
jgi:hypothetical protein